MKLVEEERVEIPSLSVEAFGDENESVRYDISDLMYKINEHEISGSKSDLNEPTHLPKWAEKTLSSVGLDVGNPVDQRRTRSDFQRACIALS